MKVTPMAIRDVLLLEPRVYEDERGLFYESFNKRVFFECSGLDVSFVQENHSRSRKSVLRGMHFQSIHSQGKLLRVIRGSVFDVAVDLRRSSPTFGNWVGVELDESSHRLLWIPAGFAHGFQVTSECADVIYKTTAYYSPADECCLAWNDPDVSIVWPDSQPILSAKDQSGLRFIDLDGYS